MPHIVSAQLLCGLFPPPGVSIVNSVSWKWYESTKIYLLN